MDKILEKSKIIENEFQAYPKDMLIACRKGKPCDYGICDECPNTLGNFVNDEMGEDN